jgi:hypothetical protein
MILVYLDGDNNLGGSEATNVVAPARRGLVQPGLS